MAFGALALALLAAAAPTRPAAAASPAAPPGRAGIVIADISWAEHELLRAAPPDKSSWRKAGEGDKLRTGDTLRTAESGTARVEFPWMTVTLGPGTMLSVPVSTVLSTVLDQGRAEFSGPGRDIVKIRVGDGEVRGGGRLVLRRSAGRTSVSALEGAFRVRAMGRAVEVKGGQGTVVSDGRPPDPPAALPEPPTGLRPGAEATYVRSGQPVELNWAATGVAHHVELLGLSGSAVLLGRDAGAPPLHLAIPWLGTFRWRVSARDARGVESRPSAEGLICSVER